MLLHFFLAQLGILGGLVGAEHLLKLGFEPGPGGFHFLVLGRAFWGGAVLGFQRLLFLMVSQAKLPHLLGLVGG